MNLEFITLTMITLKIFNLRILNLARLKLCSILIFLALLSISLPAQGKKIALLYPETTISLPTENTSWLTDNFYRWELFLIQNKYKYEVIKEDDLEDGLSDDFSLLILPAARCLSDKEIRSIKDFMNEGNSVLATWSTGVYKPDGKWKGWDDLEQLFGVSFISEISQKEGSRIHSLFGGTPVSSQIDPGFRLQITTFDKPIEVKINSANTFPLGFWANSEFPFEGKNQNDYKTSAVYGNYGKGNFVWFGFEFSAVVGAEPHQKNANQLLRNTINWLSDSIIVQMETWPDGKQAAAVLSCDVEFKFNYINNALDLFEKENLPAQFYILTESIDSLSFERLKTIGDVGLHGDDHKLFKWQDYNTQLARLASGLNTLEKVIGKKPIAFRPPETFYDNLTLEAMSALNVNVLSSDFIEDRAVPQFLKNHSNLLVIPKTGFDDYDIFERLRLNKVNDQSMRYILDFERVYREGGLYSLNFHTQMQCRKEFIDALIQPIHEIKSKDVWITTHDRVYDWWAQKSKLKLTSVSVSEEKYSVEIVNYGEDHVDDLVICIYKKNFSDLNNLQIMLDGENLDYQSDYGAAKIKVTFPRIYSKETKRIDLSF